MHNRGKAIDIGEAPLYGIPEAAFYLDIPVNTLRSWVSGRVYPTKGGPKFFHPLIDLADPIERQMSFYNLVEAHVILTFRAHYDIPIPKIRDAMDYLRGRIQHEHPLITQEFYTFGKDLIVKQLGASEKTAEVMINASRKGQLGIKDVLEIYLRRIKRTPIGMPAGLYPLRRRLPLNQPDIVEINPTVAFGNPVLKGTGVTIAMLLDRHQFGRTPMEIAEDYDLDKNTVKEAIEFYEGKRAA